MIPLAKYSDYLIFRNNHNEYFDRMSDYSRPLCNYLNKNKFSGLSPFFTCVKSELEQLQNSFWNDIMYYEFLAFQEDSERLSIVDRDNNWDIFYDVLLKSMDLSYIDELLELKNNIENIEDKEYSRVKSIIVDSDIFKKTTEIYNKSIEFIKDKEFKSSRQDNMYRIREFLNLTKMKGDSAKTKFSQMLHGLADRNKYLLLKIVNLINMDGVYKIDE